MASLADASFGIANESTPGTYVAPTRWWEVMSPEFDVRKNVKQGMGMRVGTRVARSGRRVVVTADAGGSVEVELVSKGLGLLLESCLGVAASTLVSGTTYQQNHTLATGTVLPSRTLQTGVVATDGTVFATSYLGSMVDTWELNIGNGEVATLKTNWDCMNYTTAQSYAAPSYASAPSLFHWGQAAFTLGGTVTAPTTTALASGGTAATNIRSLKLTGNNKAAKDRYNGGGAGRKARQLIGDAELSGELEIEFTDATVRDAYLADTELAFTCTLTSTEALSTGFAQLQITLPAIKLNGEVAKPNGDEPSVLKVPFDVLDNLTAAQPIWISTRTADSAL